MTPVQVACQQLQRPLSSVEMTPDPNFLSTVLENLPVGTLMTSEGTVKAVILNPSHYEKIIETLGQCGSQSKYTSEILLNTLQEYKAAKSAHIDAIKAHQSAFEAFATKHQASYEAMSIRNQAAEQKFLDQLKEHVATCENHQFSKEIQRYLHQTIYCLCATVVFLSIAAVLYRRHLMTPKETDDKKVTSKKYLYLSAVSGIIAVASLVAAGFFYYSFYAKSTSLDASRAFSGVDGKSS